MNVMNSYELKEATVTKQMQTEAKNIMAWLRNDYHESKEKIGRMRAKFEFEEFYVGKSYIDEQGRKWTTSERDTTKPVTYECVLYIYVPLTGMSFDATDEHKYRWNVIRNEFEHESTEVV